MIERSKIFKLTPIISDSPFSSGMNVGGIEIFSNEKIHSFVKEELQNTIDAQLNSSNIAYGEFQLFQYETDKYPCLDELLELINNADAFYQANLQHSKLTYAEFYQKARSCLMGKTMRCLRYSDFTDDGLYDNNSASSPRKNLLYNEGQSDKPMGSGGSKGIGKNAAYGLSVIRSIFVSSCDKNEDHMSVGITRLPSFEHNNIRYNGTILLGSGDNNNREIEYKNFDKNWHRNNKHGLDKFIMGLDCLDSDEDIYSQMIVSVLQDFYSAIYNERLVVKVGSTIINKETIEKLLQQYSSGRISVSAETIGQYIAISRKTDVAYLTCVEPNDVEVCFYEHEKGKRVCGIIGYNGIKIYNAKKNFPSGVFFDAVVTFKGKVITSIFKRAENTEHTQLKKDYFKHDKELVKHFDLIMNFVIDKIKAIQNRNFTESMDAEGVSDYLPSMFVQAKQNNKLQKDQITNTPKVPLRKISRPIKANVESSNEESLSPNNIENHNELKTSSNIKKIPQESIQTRVRVLNNNYTLAVICDKDIVNGFIKIQISGEDGFSDFIEVYDMKRNGIPCKTDEQGAIIHDLKRNTQNIFTFCANNNEHLALRVNLYENNE